MRNSNQTISLSKVEQGLAFLDLSEEQIADALNTITAMPGWGGVTPAEEAAVIAFAGNGDMNQLCEALGYEGEQRFAEAIKVITKVEKFQKNLSQRNAYANEENAEAAAVETTA